MTSLLRDPFHPAESACPKVLVADDDPASCRFLGDGMRSLGARVEIRTDGNAALECAREQEFDLLLLDCRMPEAGALQILTLLRNDSRARSADGIAVATSAELEPAERSALLAAGFSELLPKPCSLADLQRTLALVRPDGHGACMLDDRAALATSGDPVTMRALRLLLREELILLDQELEVLSREPGGFGERLHRLRSSCGFCGATTLSAQAVLLQQRLLHHAATATALARFRKALRATLQALDG
jgi:two-component system OmpR family response regulator